MASKKARGKRAKTRAKLRRGRKDTKLTVNKQLEVLGIGQKVQVIINSGVHSTLPDSRYQGLVGKVTGYRGRAFEVRIKKGNITKDLIVKSAHLKLIQEAG